MIYNDPRFRVSYGQEAQELLLLDIAQFFEVGGVVTYSCWRSMSPDERSAILRHKLSENENAVEAEIEESLIDVARSAL